MVRHVMASALAGLKPESVTVVDLNGRHYPAESANGGIGGGGGSLDRYATIKAKYEAHWQNQVAMALRFVPGVQVTANVELDPETSHTEDINLIDPKTVVYKQEETSRNKTSESGGPGGRPGLQGQQGSNQSARVGSGEQTRMTEEDTHTSTNSIVPSTVKKISQHGLTPKRVTVSVGVPSNYYTKIWGERNPAVDGQPPKKPTDADLQTIETKVKADLENTVVQLLPSPGTTVDPFPRVMVTTFQSLEEPALPAETMQAQATAMLAQHGNTVGMVLVALIALMVLRAMVRSAPTPEPAPAVEAPASSLSLVTPDDEPTESESPASKSRLKRRGPGGPSLRDELSELVKEDPDAAVSILRTWIGNPA
jgi:flagellar M-ring protein FliF